MATGTDINALVTLLITEIRQTLNARIDILNEKIELQCEENKRLRIENEKLKEIISSKDNKTTEIQHVSETLPVQTPVFQPNTPQRQRGIKVHNLIFTCPNIGEQDPREFVENLLFTKFYRKININNVQLLNTRGQQQSQLKEDVTTRGQQQSQLKEDVTTRGSSYNDATWSQNQCRILVTFNSVWEVRSIYRERIQAFRNTGIFVSEDLYKDESYLFYVARTLKRKNIINSAWTEEGQVYIVEKMGQMPRILTRNDPILNDLEKNKEETQRETKQPNNDKKREPIKKIENKSETKEQQAKDEQEKIPEDTASISTLPPAASVSTLPIHTLPASSKSLNIMETENEDSEEDEIKDLMNEALQGALTRAAKRKKKRTQKE
jgi:regulator of replication initiation timing